MNLLNQGVHAFLAAGLEQPIAQAGVQVPQALVGGANGRELLGMAPVEPAADPPADYRDRFEALTGQSLRECPHCHTGIMVVIDCIARPKVCQPVLDTS